MDFINIITEHYKISDELKCYIEDTIVNSGCQDIQFKKLNPKYFGLSSHDGVIISDNLLNMSLPLFLFILFHELTHQLQFKKYGDDMLIYLKNIPDESVSNFILKQEIIADRLSSLKIHHLQNKGLLSKDFKPMLVYRNISRDKFLTKISEYRLLMKEVNVKTPDDVSRFFRGLVLSN